MFLAITAHAIPTSTQCPIIPSTYPWNVDDCGTLDGRNPSGIERGP
jgi:hypothetical protein